MAETTSTEAEKPRNSGRIANAMGGGSPIGPPGGERGMSTRSISPGPPAWLTATSVGQSAEALRTFFPSLSENWASPIFEHRYDPAYRCELQGWAVNLPTDESAEVLAELEAAHPRPAPERATRMALRLMAKTKSRAHSMERDAILLEELARIICEYPTCVGAHVVREWDRRAGDEAIFTPSAAELRRALDDAARPYARLVEALNAAS